MCHSRTTPHETTPINPVAVTHRHLSQHTEQEISGPVSRRPIRKALLSLLSGLENLCSFISLLHERLEVDIELLNEPLGHVEDHGVDVGAAPLGVRLLEDGGVEQLWQGRCFARG